MVHLGKSILGIVEILNNYGTSWKINILDNQYLGSHSSSFHVVLSQSWLRMGFVPYTGKGWDKATGTRAAGLLDRMVAIRELGSDRAKCLGGPPPPSAHLAIPMQSPHVGSTPILKRLETHVQMMSYKRIFRNCGRSIRVHSLDLLSVLLSFQYILQCWSV